MRWAWEYFAFLANSFVFILIGMSVANQPLHRLGPLRPSRSCSCSRGADCRSIRSRAIFSWSRWRVPASFQHVLFWGGLRGALALALALAIPATVAERYAIILTAFVVVAFSILVQGLTMPWLIKRLKLGANSPSEPVAAPQH